MSDFVTALKEEIVRLARKELKKELEGLKKTSATYRSEIAALKRRIQVLEKQSSTPARPGPKPLVAAGKNLDASKLRFSAKGLTSMRTKLGLSAEGMGQLLGVSQQTIYHWENGKTRPRPEQIRAIATMRGMGKRQLEAHIGASRGKAISKKPTTKKV